MRRLLATTGLSTLFASLMVAGGAQAQTESQAAPPAAAPISIGEVVVTAQKRAENLQNVPQAVQAVSGAQLRASGVMEFADLTKVAPSLVIRPAENPVNASVSMRGIGTFAFSIGVEPSVAVQVDDVPVSFQPMAFADLADIERIEVLRGPQSTLYGKSASAGLINVVTPAPTSTYTGRINAMATGDGEGEVGGVVSGPINDTLGFRLSADYDNFRGNVKNLYNGDWVNGRVQSSIYGKLVWKPTSRFQATVGLNYIDGRQTIGRPFIALAPNANLRGNPAQPPSVWAPGVTAGLANTDVSNNVTSGTNYDGITESLRMSYDLDWATLMSITSHDSYFLKDRLDQDEGSVAAPDNRQFGEFTSSQWTQELRLVSPSDKPLRYTAGFFYAGVDYSRDFTRGPAFSLARWYGTAGSQQGAGFGQVDWEFVPGTTATAGVRYQHERVNYTFLDIQNGNAFFSGNANDNFATYKASLEHKFTRDIMGYASYATGHKGQTYDLSTGFNTNRALAGPVLPETSGSWEVGARTQFFEHRLTVNLTAFDAIYRNFQAQGIETLADGTVNYRLTNVGRIHTRGVELDSSGRLDNLQLGFSAAYLDAVIDSFPLAQCYPLQTAAQGCTGNPSRQSLTGRTPPQAPKWKLSANFDYHHGLGSLPFDGVVQGLYTYQSEVNYSLNQDPQTIQRAYGILNLSAGIRDPIRHYEIMAFVNNLTDQHYYSNLYNSTGNYSNALATQALPPRDFGRYAGVRASYSF
ncbi:MAG: TonB-dependent receptor [Caulobacteraceae bacterium]|jgi:iron complex outermembrane receptor protein|nr:TonB-dependent receptor [Caulobacteraceae bacterium]